MSTSLHSCSISRPTVVGSLKSASFDMRAKSTRASSNLQQDDCQHWQHNHFIPLPISATRVMHIHMMHCSQAFSLVGYNMPSEAALNLTLFVVQAAYSMRNQSDALLIHQTFTGGRFWAAQYNTWLLIELTPKGVVFSFLFYRWHVSNACAGRSGRADRLITHLTLMSSFKPARLLLICGINQS